MRHLRQIYGLGLLRKCYKTIVVRGLTRDQSRKIEHESSHAVAQCIYAAPNSMDENTTTSSRHPLSIYLIAFLVGIYSLIKWSKHGHESLIFTSILLIALELISAFSLKWFKQPALSLNLGFVGMSVHALNIIYQSGGVVDSTKLTGYLC